MYGMYVQIFLSKIVVSVLFNIFLLDSEEYKDLLASHLDKQIILDHMFLCLHAARLDFFIS